MDFGKDAGGHGVPFFGCAGGRDGEVLVEHGLGFGAFGENRLEFLFRFRVVIQQALGVVGDQGRQGSFDDPATDGMVWLRGRG